MAGAYRHYECRVRPSRGRHLRVLIAVVCPITDNSPGLAGGVMLNRNLDVVNAVRDRIYGAGTLPPGGIGVVAMLLGDVRISSNIPAPPGTDAVGLRLPSEVRKRVLENGGIWAMRDYLADQWYISGYAPLFDVQGQAVGVLHAGFLEAPFRRAHYCAAAPLLLILLVLFSVSAWIAFRGAKRVFQPIEQMTAVVRATQAGLERRIGEIDSQDEMRELARQFDAMLDLLQQRNREIQRSADELEAKVEEHTRELESRNADLKATVDLLHKTRQQLVRRKNWRRSASSPPASPARSTTLPPSSWGTWTFWPMNSGPVLVGQGGGRSDHAAGRAYPSHRQPAVATRPAVADSERCGRGGREPARGKYPAPGTSRGQGEVHHGAPATGRQPHHPDRSLRPGRGAD
jgi:hypothetical protein